MIHAENRTPVLAALLAIVTVLAPAPALAVDPSLDWYTIETPNFRVHFHEGAHMYELAERTARVCEAAHALLVPRLRWQPGRKTDVILSDDADSANGSAFTQYRPWLRLFAEVPDDESVLNDYEDYLWNLIVHEYTHVLHLDTVTGMPEAFDRIFGKILIPNAVTPRWLTEGLATYEESNLSESGRLRSSLFDMWLRASITEHPFTLDDVSNTPQQWPRGNLAYLYGAFFLSYVAHEVGEESLPDYFDLYGGRLIPYTLNDAARTAWNRDFVGLYDAWLKAETARFDAQLQPIRAAKVTPLHILTHSGYTTDNPRFSRDGARIYYMEAGPDRLPALRVMNADGTGDRLVRELVTSGPFDLSPDGAHAVLALNDVYEEYQTFDDLYEVDLSSGELSRLTEGLRATEPRYSPDGARIVFVGRSGGGYTYLGVLDHAKPGVVEKLAEAGPNARFYTPTFTPDGRAIVASQQAIGGRRIVSVDRETREQRTWLEAPWLMLQPTFGPDGALYFTADRTGVYNLHRFDPASGELSQLTDVETGVFRPDVSRDGSRIACVRYGSNGYDIAVMNADDAFAGPALPERAERGPRRYVDDPTDVMPVRRYSPLETIAPTWWLPTVGQDPRGPTIGAVTGGSDILERHSWSLDAELGVTSLEPSVFAAYSNRTFHPGFDAYATTAIAQMANFPAGYYEREWAAGAQTTFPNSTYERSIAVTLGYELRYFDPKFRVPLHPDDPQPLLPRRGTTGTASVAFSFSNAHASANAISAEQGVAVVATVRESSPYTLGTFTLFSGDARVQTYLEAPWAKHQVFALRLAAGTAAGDLGDRPVFALGGFGIADPVLQLIRGQRAGGGALRGYPSQAFAGNTFALGTLEYRLPLVQLDYGWDTLPFYVRRVHGAVFTDVGMVGVHAFETGPLEPSAGAELRGDFLLGYAMPAEVRLGYAHGFGDRGIENVYLSVGSSF